MTHNQRQTRIPGAMIETDAGAGYTFTLPHSAHPIRVEFTRGGREAIVTQDRPDTADPGA